jgi:hypothetical protein
MISINSLSHTKWECKYPYSLDTEVPQEIIVQLTLEVPWLSVP